MYLRTSLYIYVYNMYSYKLDSTKRAKLIKHHFLIIRMDFNSDAT